MRTGLIMILPILLAYGGAGAAEPGIAITVYNTDLALVKDVRRIDVREGVADVKFTDVAERIDPTSVHFKVVEGPDAAVWEQNYRFDLASSSKILERYLEKDIDVVTQEADLFSGTLISVDGNAIVLDQGRGSGPVVSVNREKVMYMRFPALPEGLISRPTLVWKIGAERGGERLVEVTYLTSSINWHAEYVGVVSDDDTSIDLAAWVSIDNRSGASYENAKLDLVAGDVHQIREQRYDRGAGMVEMAMAKAPPSFEEEALFEYHLYKLDGRSTVADREIKQLTFFPSTGVDVVKMLEFDWRRGGDVRVLLEFENSKKAGLGIPLPAGKVRMYKEDSVGDLQFIGEDAVDHTPKDEDVELYMGNAFDVTAERKTMASRKITNKVHEEDYEVTLRNHKDEGVVVKVIDHPHGFWSVTKSSHEHEKVEANRIEFTIPVEKDGETKLTYTVRYEY